MKKPPSKPASPPTPTHSSWMKSGSGKRDQHETYILNSLNDGNAGETPRETPAKRRSRRRARRNGQRVDQKSLEERGRIEQSERHTEDARESQVVTVLRWFALPLVVIVSLFAPVLPYKLAAHLEFIPMGFWGSAAKQGAYVLGGFLAISLAQTVSSRDDKVFDTAIASLTVGAGLSWAAFIGEVSWWVLVIVALFVPRAIIVAKEDSQEEKA